MVKQFVASNEMSHHRWYCNMLVTTDVKPFIKHEIELC